MSCMPSSLYTPLVQPSMEELTKAEGTPEDATMDVPLLTLKEVNMPMNLVVIHALFCRHLWMAKSDPHVLDTGLFIAV